MLPLLEGKNAIIYGAAGRIGRAVARTFAQEGATVFLVGRLAIELHHRSGHGAPDGSARFRSRPHADQGSGAAWTPPGVWPMGGTGPADAATESFMRYLASEVGPSGVRVVGLWTAGVASEPGRPSADPEIQRLETAKDALVSMSMLRKRPTVQEVADTAAFLASDRGRGITASIVNVTSGISAL